MQEIEQDVDIMKVSNRNMRAMEGDLTFGVGWDGAPSLVEDASVEVRIDKEHIFKALVQQVAERRDAGRP